MAANNAKILTSIATEIKALEKRTIADIIEIGRLLTLAVDQLEHREYAPWLKDNFSWSISTAWRYREAYTFFQIVQAERFGYLGQRASPAGRLPDRRQARGHSSRPQGRAAFHMRERGRYRGQAASDRAASRGDTAAEAEASATEA